MDIGTFRKNLESRILENEMLKRQIEEHYSKISENTRLLGIVKDLMKIIENLALEKRNGLKSGIENVVTEALRVLYGSGYKFEMEYSQKNNRSCLNLYVVQKIKDGAVKRQMDGFGGGVSDCISIPLRMMVLKGSETGDILILDEAFVHVDRDMPELVGQFLKKISETLGMQIIFSTHHERILDFADKGFLIKNVDGEVKT